MNLKAIDAAIAAYRTNLDEGDVSRLAFFQIGRASCRERV